MPGRLLELHAENFRSLREVTIPLGPLTVLMGPNGVGKSNVLKVFDFLAAIIRTDLQPALAEQGGFDEVSFWGGDKPPTSMTIRLKATWTTYASLKAPDEYELTIRRRSVPNSRGAFTLSRQEKFEFKRTEGRGRRIKISGGEARVVEKRAGKESDTGGFGIQRLSSGLSTLPRLGRSDGGEEVTRVADRLSSFRIFNVDVTAARQPTRASSTLAFRLDPHAENLAAFLDQLSADEECWQRLTEDARRILPQLKSIEFEQVGGYADRLAVVLHERGLRRPTPLADASFGTVRLLGLLAMLYDPHPRRSPVWRRSTTACARKPWNSLWSGCAKHRHGLS